MSAIFRNKNNSQRLFFVCVFMSVVATSGRVLPDEEEPSVPRHAVAPGGGEAPQPLGLRFRRHV